MALFAVGALVGSIAGGPLFECLGRKLTIILGSGVVALGGLIHTSAFHLWFVLNVLFSVCMCQ